MVRTFFNFRRNFELIDCIRFFFFLMKLFLHPLFFSTHEKKKKFKYLTDVDDRDQLIQTKFSVEHDLDLRRVAFKPLTSYHFGVSSL